MVHKSRIVTTLCIALLIVLVFTLPFPTRVDISVDGAFISPDGSVIDEGEISIVGWRLDYLFKRSELKLDYLVLTSLNISDQTYYPTPIYDELSDEYDYIFTLMYLPRYNRYAPVNICLDKDGEWCAVSVDGNRFFAGSISGEKTPHELLEFCQDVLN